MMGLEGELYPTAMTTSTKDEGTGEKTVPTRMKSDASINKRMPSTVTDSDSPRQQIDRVAGRPVRVTGSDYDDQR